jgi:hypothetical protein
MAKKVLKRKRDEEIEEKNEPQETDEPSTKKVRNKMLTYISFGFIKI